MFLERPVSASPVQRADQTPGRFTAKDPEQNQPPVSTSFCLSSALEMLDGAWKQFFLLDSSRVVTLWMLGEGMASPFLM